MEVRERTELAQDLKVLFPEEFGGHLTVTPVVAIEIENDDERSAIENPSIRDQEVFDSLTVEQQIKVVRLKQVIAEKFERLGAKAEDFSVFPRRTWDSENHEWAPGGLTVAYAAPRGIDLAYAPDSPHEEDMRSWGSIFAGNDSNDERFIIKVGDEEFDTRAGMTGRAYVDLFEQCSKTGSQQEAPLDADGFTYLTGDPVQNHWVTKADWDFEPSLTGDGKQVAILYPHTANRETIRLAPGEWENVPDFIDSQGIPVGRPHMNHLWASIGVLWSSFRQSEEASVPLSDPCSFRPAIIVE